MIVRTLFEFSSTLPYDGIEDEFDFVQYPGKNIAEAILDVVQRLGCEPYRSIEYIGYPRGWDFTFRYRGWNIYCEVNMIDEYLVYFDGSSSLRNLFKSFEPRFVEFLRKVGGELASDPRFVKVRWYTHKGYDAHEPAAARPVD